MHKSGRKLVGQVLRGKGYTEIRSETCTPCFEGERIHGNQVGNLSANFFGGKGGGYKEFRSETCRLSDFFTRIKSAN